MTDRPWYEQYIVRNPDILSGTPVLAGTRLPAATVFTCVDRGMTIGQVIDAFPSINAVQAQAAIEYTKAHPDPYIPARDSDWRGLPLSCRIVIGQPLQNRKPH